MQGVTVFICQAFPQHTTVVGKERPLIAHHISGVSILTSYTEKPPVKTLPIFSELIENSAKGAGAFHSASQSKEGNLALALPSILFS